MNCIKDGSRLIQPRGLKYARIMNPVPLLCRGLYSLVDWNKTKICEKTLYNVEAYTASWIEISYIRQNPFLLRSRLIQPRGLKYCQCASHVTSLSVEAYTASWIEMHLQRGITHKMESRLIQPRGLKYICLRFVLPLLRRGLYSLVDWNIHPSIATALSRVEAYTASWIEIWSPLTPVLPERSRGLYSLVDWNFIARWSSGSLPGRGLYSLVDWNMKFRDT